MPYNLAMAMRTSWRKRMDGTLETIKKIGFTAHNYFEVFVVFIFTCFTGSHITNPNIIVEGKQVNSRAEQFS
jgi:hypothetical protein